MGNYFERKSELLIKRDELLAIDREKVNVASRLKEKLEILNVRLIPDLPDTSIEIRSQLTKDQRS